MTTILNAEFERRTYYATLLGGMVFTCLAWCFPPDARRCVHMRLLYTLCWLMICLGIFMIFGTLGYDIPILDTLTIENARTATEVQRDT